MRALLSTVTDESQTGPWALALGALTIAVAAVAAAVLRRRRTDSGEERGDGLDADGSDGDERDGGGDGGGRRARSGQNRPG